MNTIFFFIEFRDAQNFLNFAPKGGVVSQRIFIAHIVCRFNYIYVFYCSPDLITDNQFSYYPLA